MKIVTVLRVLCVVAGLGLTSCHWFGSNPVTVAFDERFTEMPDGNDPLNSEGDLTEPEKHTPEPQLTDKPQTATAVNGKPGIVVNPYTGNWVNVVGIPAGTLVKDPADIDGRPFYVP